MKKKLLSTVSLLLVLALTMTSLIACANGVSDQAVQEPQVTDDATATVPTESTTEPATLSAEGKGAPVAEAV